MFNTTNVSVPTAGFGFISASVTERRAPTDESVRLLKEMEDEARKKVIETTVVSDTHFECKIHRSHDVFSAQDVYVVIYSLNGQKRSVKVGINTFDKPNPTDIAVAIRDKVAEDISNEVLKVAFKNMVAL